MASLLRPRQLSVLQRCVLNQLVRRNRNISTSKKNSDTVAATVQEPAVVPKKEENWVSYGFSYTSKEEDTNWHNASFFFTVTICFVFGGFSWAYAPDINMRDWAQREAFLELRRREKAGEPVISPHFIDPALIELPDELELEDVELVI